MTPTIYRIEFPDGRFYIGASVNFSARRRTHLHHARNAKSVNSLLQEAFNTNHICGIYQVASGFSRETLHLLEAQIIEQEAPPLNVNTSPTPLAPKYSGANKNWGPHKCLRDAAEALGISYDSAKKAARRYSYEVYVDRLTTPKQTRADAKIGPPDPRKDPALTFLDGWMRKRDICVVPWSNYEGRRKKGWPEHKALLTPVYVPPVSARKVAKRYGVDQNTYYQRRCRNWTVYEALGLAPRPEPRKAKVKKRTIEAGGQTLPVTVWAKKLGISPGVIHGRLHLGWTEAEAVGVERRAVDVERDDKKAELSTRKRRSTPIYTHRGFTGTISEICREFGYNDANARARRKAGKPFERWFDPVGCTADPYTAYVAQLEEVHSPEEARRIADEVFKLDWLQDETV